VLYRDQDTILSSLVITIASAELDVWVTFIVLVAF